MVVAKTMAGMFYIVAVAKAPAAVWHQQLWHQHDAAEAGRGFLLAGTWSVHVDRVGGVGNDVASQPRASPRTAATHATRHPPPRHPQRQTRSVC